jgi:hypothetical protein
MDDIALSFDPSGFLSGLNAVTDKLGTLNNNFQQMGQKGQKQTQAVGLSAKNLLGVFGKLGMLAGAVKGLLSGIPELGQTFKIAGDIFQKNFLWPLRKELMPILQSFLNWVRDNRAMFVKWGTVLANVFRSIFSILKMVMKIAKDLFRTLADSLERIFGKTTQTVTDMMNVILFKITAIAMFILMTLKPIFEFLIDQFTKIIERVKNFAEGFWESFGSVIPILKEFANLWDRIMKIFNKLTPAQSKVNSSFKRLGSILGTTVLVVLLAIVSALDLVITGVEKAVNRLSYFNAWRKGDKREMKLLNTENEKINRDAKKRFLERGEMIKNSAIRTKDILMGTNTKEQVTTNNNSSTNIKGQVTTNNNSGTTVNDNKVVNINVSGARGPEETAKTVERNLPEELRESKFRAGGR